MKSFIQKRGIIISIFILLVHFVAQYLGEEYKTIEAISKAMLLVYNDIIFVMVLYNENADTSEK